MQPINEEAAATDVVERDACSDYALRIAGPADGQLEVSVDGAPYRPCRYADGCWWHHWTGTLAGAHHMVVVIRSATTPRPRRD